MGRKTGRNDARRALPVFEALESRALLSRTLPIPLVPPGVRVVQSGSALYEVRLSGPGTMRLRPMGGGQFGVDLFGTTDASALSVSRTKVRPHFRIGSLPLGRIDVKSGHLGTIQAPVAVLQGALTNLNTSMQTLTLGGLGPRARLDLPGNMASLNVGVIQLGPSGLLHVGGRVEAWQVGSIDMNGGQVRFDDGMTQGHIGGIALRGRSQLSLGDDVGWLDVAGDAAILGGSALEVSGSVVGLKVDTDDGEKVFGMTIGGTLLVASTGRFDVRQDMTGTLTVGDDLRVDGGLFRVGREIQSELTIGDDLDVRGNGRFNVARDVVQPLHVVGDLRLGSGGGVFVDRNLAALRIDGNLDTTAGGVLRVGANVDELTVGGVIVGRGSLGTSVPDIRIGLNLHNLKVLGMLPNRGGIASADIDVIKSIIGFDIRQGVFNSLITAGVLIQNGTIGPDGTAAVQDSQIRAGARIDNVTLNGDVVSTPGGIQPTRIVAGQDRDGSFRAAGNIDQFFISGSLIDAVVVASVVPTGGNGGFNPSPTWPAVPPGEGYDATIGYVTGGFLSIPRTYVNFAPGGFNEFGEFVGRFYDTAIDPVIDDVILSGAINGGLVQPYPSPFAGPETVVPLPSRSTVAGGVYRTPGAVDFAGLFAADTRGVFVGRLPQSAQ